MEPESNQTSRMSSTFFQPSLGAIAEEARGGAFGVPGIGAFLFESIVRCAWFTAGSFRISTEPSAFSLTNTAIGTPQARWREITQSGRLSIMPVMRFSPAGGIHWVASIAVIARWRSVSPLPGDILVHRDEPLRRVAEDHRLLGAPRMRILMLEPAARDDVAGLDQRLDHGVVGVALLALVVDHALAGEARRMRGQRAVLVDGVRDGGVDPVALRAPRAGGPDLEVLAAMARRGVHEAGAGIVGDVIAGEQRHGEVIAERAERMRAAKIGEIVGRHVGDLVIRGDARLLEHVAREIFRQDEADRRTSPSCRARHR